MRSLCVLLLIAGLCAACHADSPLPATAQPAGDAAAGDVTAAGPAGLDFALPAPSSLRTVSWEPGCLLAYGADFVEDWPSSNVDPDYDGWAEYSGYWLLEPEPTTDDLAYAMYSITVDPATDRTLYTSWDTAPQAGECYLGLANRLYDRWEWFECTGAPLALPQYEPYLAEGALTAVVCVLAEGPFRLNWLRCGPELAPEALLTSVTDHISWGQEINFRFDKYCDPENAVTLYELDYDGDGTYDFDSSTERYIDHVYDTPGIYTAVGRVTDAAGLSDTAELTIWVSAFETTGLDGQSQSPSFTILDNGYPAIIYARGETFEGLCLARQNEFNWTSYQMDPIAGEADIETALVVDPDNGQPVVAFGGHDLRIGRIDGYSLTGVELLDESKALGRPAIALDADGYASVFYSRSVTGDPPETNFTRCYDSAGGWQYETLDLDSPTGRFCDAAGGSQLCSIYAAEEGENLGSLKYGLFDATWSWQSAAEDMAAAYNGLALALDPGGAPRILYVSDPAGAGESHSVVYSAYDGSAWQPEVLEPGGEQGDVAIDAAGNPWVIVSVTDALSRPVFWLHRFDGTMWQREFVHCSEAGVVRDLQITLDADGVPHLVWCVLRQGEQWPLLRYAKRTYGLV